MVIVLWIVSFAAILLVAGVSYQYFGGRRDRKRFANPGRWVDAERGCRLFLCEFGGGEPTVIFEAGIGATHLNWRHVQKSVSQFATTASYDRAGLGWSDPSKTARTPANIAAELHQMLRRAGLKPPYVMVGHSFGGLVVRRFALLYPTDVAGVLLIDPMRCEEWPPLNPAGHSQINTGKKMLRYAIPVTRSGIARLGVSLLFCRARKLSRQIAGVAVPNAHHVLSRITTEVGKMPREVWPAVASHWSRPDFYAGLRSHIVAIPDTVREMHVAEPIRSVPVTVLTPASATPLTDNQLDHIGERVSQVFAANSDHWIHLDEPDLVINSIHDLVTSAVTQSVMSTL